MGQLARFLDKYDTIIFDLDGVITSEENYWTAAALTVWEWLFKDSYSPDMITDNAVNIRKKVLCNDKVIRLLKNKGVNSNWDLGYIIYAVCRIYNTVDFNEVMSICEKFSDNIIDEYPVLAEKLSLATGEDGSRNGKLWTDMMLSFQSWFLGDDLFYNHFGVKPVNSGKSGLIENEKPIIDKDVLVDVFKKLKCAGKRIATGTGRPSAEMIKPLKDFGIFDFFDTGGLINYDYVQNAEKAFGTTLSKPHPYVFIKAMLGNDYSDERILSGNYNKDKAAKTLVVGDAGADIFAAKAMGADFCAVLTGISGQTARDYFEKYNAEHILNSLADFIV